jgi:hypothetical protein
MARKILNRKELREENDAAEAVEATEEKPAKKTAAKRPTARKSRAKTAKEVRLKAFWEVCNQTGKPVVRFEYSERKQADKKAAELSASAKTPHFVQLRKEMMDK